jgi:hypothetical protein
MFILTLLLLRKVKYMAIQDKSIYPTTFFNIPHPASPVVSIQFRTKTAQGKSIDDPSLWEEITFDPNNFFSEMSIEDESGYPKLSLTLVDQNYTYLENTIVKTMVAQRLSNKLVEKPNISKDDTGYFEFFVDKKKSANIRVRIGYSEQNLNSYISDPDFEGKEYSSRANSNRPVIRSPWIYFMITGLDMNIIDNGLQVTIEGRDSIGSFFDKAVMIQKFAKLKGTPKNIINRIGDQIKASSKKASESGSETICIEIVDEPLMYVNRDGGKEIDIMLGGKPVVRELRDGTRQVETQYKKVKQLFREICSKISPVMYREDGSKIPISSDGSADGTEVNSKSSEMRESYPYTFSFVRKNDKDVIQFYYKDPRNGLRQQPNIRTYIWGEHGQSIVQNVDVTVSQAFSYLNLPIMSFGEDGTKEVYISKAKDPKEDDNISEFDSSLGGIEDVSNALNNADFDFTFTSEVINTSEYETNTDTITSSMAAKRMMRSFNSNINETIAEGNITLQGDPFYFFDDKVKPFQYIINLVIKRPNYIDKNGDYVEGGKSYLSGLYRIKKITHAISAGSYTTNLEVIKTPF